MTNDAGASCFEFVFGCEKRRRATMLNQRERNDAREIAKRSEQTGIVVYSDMGILVPLALLEAEAELTAAKAEVERLRVLVETAFVDALIFVAGWDADLAAEKWNDSDAKRALEKGKGSACDER
jgi:hypothetical protein